MSAISVSAPFPIFTDIDGDPLEFGYIYVGQANLDPVAFPKAAYWDAEMTIAAAQPIRTNGGYPVRSGSPARVYVDGDYSIRVNNKNGTLVYSAPAVTERVDSVIVSYDSITAQDVFDSARPMANYTALRAYTGRATSVRITQVGLAGFFSRDASDTTSSDNGGTVIVDAAGRRWKRLYSGPTNVQWFGAVGDWNGTSGTDNSPAFAAAVSVVKLAGGGSIFTPHGRYLLNGVSGADGVLNGIMLPFTGGSDTGATAISINLVFEDRDTTLIAGSNNMIMIRCSTSYSEISSFQIDANGKTGVTGLALVPENLTTPAAQSQQSHNHIHDFHIGGCAEGVVLQSGGVGGAYYNHIGPGQVYGNGAAGNGGTGNTRGVYLKTGIGGTASPPNRNHFVSVRVGNSNAGFHVESGDSNKFTGCSVEGIAFGALPLSTPTGVKVGGGTQATQGSMFFGFVAEACTRDAEILDSRTQFFGFILNAAKTILAADFVASTSGTMIGSYDWTVFPDIYAGTVEYGSQLPAGIGSYEFGTVRNNLEFFDKGFKYKSFPLSTSNVSGVNSIGEAKSYCTKLANMVDWSFRFSFNPTSSSVVLTIPLPATASLNAYATYSTIPPFTFLVRLQIAATEVVGFAEVNYENPAGTYLKIRLPSGSSWNSSAGNNNFVHGNIRYRAA